MPTLTPPLHFRRGVVADALWSLGCIVETSEKAFRLTDVNSATAISTRLRHVEVAASFNSTKFVLRC